MRRAENAGARACVRDEAHPELNAATSSIAGSATVLMGGAYARRGHANRRATTAPIARLNELDDVPGSYNSSSGQRPCSSK
jgi:hypothetical protein